MQEKVETELDIENKIVTPAEDAPKPEIEPEVAPFQEEEPKLEISSAVVMSGNQNIPTQVGDFSFNANEKSENGIINRSYNIGFNENIKNVTLSANLTENDGKFSHSENLNYNLSTDNFGVNANLNNTDGQVTYSADANWQDEFNNGLSANASVHSDNNNSSVTVEVKKRLINPNNIANIKNQDQERKEELIETGDRFSLQTKVGKSKDKGFYTNNSLMYRIDNDNFLQTDFNQNQNNSRQISATTDLKHFKLSYANEISRENVANEEMQTVTKTNTQVNKVDLNVKGTKNQYTANLTHVKTEVENKPCKNPAEVTNETTTNLSLETGAILNRTEYGEFNSGLNGEIKTAISFGNGKFSGYNIGLDGAYNYYGEEHDSTTDYLLRANVSFGKNNGTKLFSSELSGAYRINNCNTIFEPSIKYSTNHSDATKNDEIVGQIGVFQNVGKKFNDAVIYTTLEAGKKWENTKGFSYFNWNVGSKVKLSKKFTLNSNINLGTRRNFGGEIGGNISF